MCKKSFNWDRKTWTVDYLEYLETFKEAILASIKVSFPNYEYTFILRTDASIIAWGGVLIQVTPGGLYECISFVSAKFTDTAAKWDIHNRFCTCYAVHTRR